MRATVTSPKMLARPRSWPYSTLPRSWPSASTTSSRRSSRIARRSKLSCNSCRSSANPSVCSRCSNSACVIPAAWSPDSQSTNLSNRVNEAVKTPSTVSDAYACTRLLLCQRSGVGTHEPNGKEPLSITTRPPRRRSTPSTAHLQTSRTRFIWIPIPSTVEFSMFVCHWQTRNAALARVPGGRRWLRLAALSAPPARLKLLVGHDRPTASPLPLRLRRLPQAHRVLPTGRCVGQTVRAGREAVQQISAGAAGSSRYRPPHRVRDGVQAEGLADQERRPVVHHPTLGTRAVEVAQVVVALVGTPVLGTVDVVEDRVPVHELVRTEGSGRLVLKPGVLPLRHRVLPLRHHLIIRQARSQRRARASSVPPFRLTERRQHSDGDRRG